MTLDEIVLHDFGVYAGENKICLTPKPGKPVVLFGGLNGAGKTTILDALQLCLFGAMARCAGRADCAYNDYLERSIHRRALYEQASVGVVFRRFAEGKEVRYRVTRVWKKSGNGIKETLNVTVDKMPASAIARNWEAHVNQIMPANIAQLFFFDGEKAALYALPESARALIKTGVHNLLSMDVVEQGDRDLRMLERRRRAEKLPEIERNSIAEREKEIGEMEKQSSVLTEKAGEIQSRKIDAGYRKLETIRNAYRDLGGDLRDRVGRIKRRLQRAHLCLNAVKRRMYELAAGRLPLLLVADMLPWMDERRREESKAQLAMILVDVLESRDREMMTQLSKNKFGQQAVDFLKKFSTADIRKRRAEAKGDILMGMDSFTAGAVAQLVDGDMNIFVEKLNMVMKQWERWTLLTNDLESEFHSIPGEDVFVENLRAQDELMRDIKHAEEEVAKFRNEQERIFERCEKLRAEIKKIEEKNSLAELAHKDMTRFLSHCKNTRTTMLEFKQKVIRRHIRRIEEFVLESYRLLMRKQSLVARVTINPETFDVVLYDAIHHPIPAEQLSKGEQQLLAVALLWGMARASGKALPMAIDTPLGRLDSGHRLHLVERYFVHASHQVLLFSTDEEIIGEYLRKLLPYISRSYLLSYDDSKGSTSISEGVLKKS